jgi:hypothetical protein
MKYINLIVTLSSLCNVPRYSTSSPFIEVANSYPHAGFLTIILSYRAVDNFMLRGLVVDNH